ncbi:MAG: HAD hydrolase family protein [Zoogloeaceae bacterium]|jgi:3-deoxy-D-manno-octulosonate 8-phosphate phosphatase (KDO 8-P phosphatase)|nr:HAD hydrolase family protein [Zoogloeaceae bacterium]
MRADFSVLCPKLRLMAFDVDGVLTDGRLFFTESGEEIKAFSSLDGHGLKCLQTAGVELAIITGRACGATRARMKGLGIRHLFEGIADKVAAMQTLLNDLSISWAEAGYMGDDLPDLPVLQRVGFAAAPANAHGRVREAVCYVSQAKGGEGAAREVCDTILFYRGQPVAGEHLA